MRPESYNKYEYNLDAKNGKVPVIDGLNYGKEAFVSNVIHIWKLLVKYLHASFR